MHFKYESQLLKCKFSIKNTINFYVNNKYYYNNFNFPTIYRYIIHIIFKYLLARRGCLE